jgi:hypothetical protein
LSARRGIGRRLGALAVCGVYAVRVLAFARVSQRGGAREQVRHSSNINYPVIFSRPRRVKG